MNHRQPSLRKIGLQIILLTSGTAGLGALLAFLFLTVINPLPQGEASVQELDTVSIILFISVAVFAFITLGIVSQRLSRPIQTWYDRLQSGTPAAELPVDVARRVLNWPFINAGVAIIGWIATAAFFGIAFRSLINVIGISISAILAITVIYAGADILWRGIIPVFFPDGHLSKIPAYRLAVHWRLLWAFLLVGLLPPFLLVTLSLSRSRALIDSPNPEVVLRNLIIVQIFILAASILTSVGIANFVSRAIIKPLRTLQEAMGKVEENNLDARVPVTSNDEFGYLGERFNDMTAGLRRGEQLRKLFSLYVSPEVAQAAVETGAGLGGQMCECTIMFSDLRDFTSLTERLTPETLVDLINRYMTAMVSVIVDHGGVVTRFGGDSILAVFGSPLNSMTDHADQAVNAAFQMRHVLQDFNQNATSDPFANGVRPILENGIGIATGPVIAGNVGGKERIEYTVMGDAANLASRLEGMTTDFNYPILISKDTFDAIGTLNARPLPDVLVKGKAKPVTIYGLS
ncbi:MAG: adenylate/guanylate cyclase domain-containing protein [Candidatus Promineifilaceae bacterium]|nr:adenylate/guanylate cyclase domain-containing protein [Candidatus Promineifilaceae bacterium]